MGKEIPSQELKFIDADETRAILIFSDERVKALYFASRDFYQYSSMSHSEVEEGSVQTLFKKLEQAREDVGGYLKESRDGTERLEREYIVMLAHITGLDEVIGKISRTPSEVQIGHALDCLAQFPA